MESRRYDALRRAIRSFFQGAVAVLIITAVPFLNTLITSVGSGGDVVIDLPFWRNIGFAALAGGSVSLISFLHNLLEDKGVVPAYLKGKASSGTDPVPDGMP